MWAITATKLNTGPLDIDQVPESELGQGRNRDAVSTIQLNERQHQQRRL